MKCLKRDLEVKVVKGKLWREIEDGFVEIKVIGLSYNITTIKSKTQKVRTVIAGQTKRPTNFARP